MTKFLRGSERYRSHISYHSIADSHIPKIYFTGKFKFITLILCVRWEGEDDIALFQNVNITFYRFSIDTYKTGQFIGRYSRSYLECQSLHQSDKFVLLGNFVLLQDVFVEITVNEFFNDFLFVARGRHDFGIVPINEAVINHT